MQSQELGMVLQQLLDAPIERALELLGFATQPLLVPREIDSVRALLEHRSPPLELLDAVFRGAQTSTTVTRSAADVLQLAALSAGMMRCGVEVSPMQQPTFLRLFEIATRLDWIDDTTKDILDDGLAALTQRHLAPPEISATPAAPDAAAQSATMRAMLTQIPRADAKKPDRIRTFNVRDLLNSHPRVALFGISGIISVALIFIVCTVLGISGPTPPSKATFSVDDGKTYFTDDIQKIAPFESGGKPAYRAQLFRCGKGTRPFVGFLERYTPVAKARLEELRKKDPASGMMDPVVRIGIEVKKPGDKEWVKLSDYAKSQGIIAPTCPDAAQALEPVFPQ